MLSKSLYIPSNGTLFESTKGVPIPEVKNMDKAIRKINKYDVDLNKDLKIKYEIARIEREFKEYIDNLNYKQAAAPFITNTFHIQRKKAYKQLLKVIENCTFQEQQFYKQKFIEKVDKHFLYDFKQRMKEPYVDLVFQKHYNLPKEVDLKQIKQTEAYTELYNLSLVVAIWTVEIELAADLLERCQLYDLCDNNEEKKDVIERLKHNKPSENKFSMDGFTKKLLKSVLIKLVKKLSSFFSAKGLNYTSISWSACVGILYYIVGGAAMPWAFIASQINIPWICGGFLASKLLDKVGDKIAKSELMTDLKAVQEAIQQNAEELMIYQKTINEMVDKCYNAESEKEYEFFKKSLNHKLDHLLNPNLHSGNLNVSTNLTKSRLNLSMITVQETDDWVICDLKEEDEDEEENEQDDIPIIHEDVEGEIEMEGYK